MDAQPILYTLARVLDEHGMEAVLIGNAAAALQGAPVTTRGIHSDSVPNARLPGTELVEAAGV